MKNRVVSMVWSQLCWSLATNCIEIVRGLFIGRGGVGEGLLERYGKPKD